MQTHCKTPLCRYHYDALDRLVDCRLSGQESARRFYQKDRLATEINSTVQHSIMQHDDHLLAQQQRQTDAMETRLLATDQQRSVLSALNATTPRPVTYTPYGHRPLSSGLLSLLGFNGERPDPVTGHYLLGNGYRAFNPGLMRFNSPDNLSPFGAGGINAYVYCMGDPINREDRSGHTSILTLIRDFFRSASHKTPRLLSASSESVSNSASSLRTAPSSTVDVPIGVLIPEVDINPAFMAESTIAKAKKIQYSGRKLKKLEHSTSTLKNHEQNSDKLIRRITNRLFEDYGDSTSHPADYHSNAVEIFNRELTRQKDTVIRRTEKLNKKIRGS